ncbi:MAG: TRAP transporter substrate-binding protein [Methylococcales bacterium]|jgi:TRAP-type mannitol/chloroaromatic compound transport system substrate-binding protein|nr:TRAP transporter substrate-binding protein [Methylococcales bacterium]MBT7443164.1 TRAP transporter substrate-binding protein [Methylococcales bacterium]
MKRRDFVTGVLAGSALLAGCNEQTADNSSTTAKPKKVIKWKMVTTWPKDFPGLGTGANNLARLIGEMSGGRLQVKVYGAKDLVPAFGVFDAVAQGTTELGHGAAYYWKGKSEAAQFFTSVPFGMTAQEMNAWLYYGDGLKLWTELYKPFGIVPFPAGNMGVQMGGWFNKEINTVADLNGLKMRIPGLGAEVLKKLGGTPVNLPGGELFTSLQSGAIDATEWVGPYNDLAFGFYKIAKHYYYPGWHEPGSVLECIVNEKALKALPEDLQVIVESACKIVNQDMLAEFTAKNNQALDTLVNVHKVDLRPFPNDVLKQFLSLSMEAAADVSNRDPNAKKIFDSFMGFRSQVMNYHKISEQAFLNARSPV